LGSFLIFDILGLLLFQAPLKVFQITLRCQDSLTGGQEIIASETVGNIHDLAYISKAMNGFSENKLHN
jgi:hypothetical protein